MVTLRDLQETIIRSIYDSQDFTDLCVSKVGQKLNFFKDAATVRFDEGTLPYLVVHKFNKVTEVSKDNEWILQFLIGIKADEKYVEVNGIKEYVSTNTVEELSDLAMGIANEELRCFGVNGETNIFIVGYNVLITEIGEAEDVQAIVTFTVSQESLIGRN